MAKEVFKVIGTEHKSYVSKRTGKPTEGYNLYTTQVFEEKPKDLIGDACCSFWIRPENMPEKALKVGDVVAFTYNRFGQVESVEPVKVSV